MRGMADLAADGVRSADTDANASTGRPRDASLYLPDSGPGDLLCGPLILVTISRALSGPVLPVLRRADFDGSAETRAVPGEPILSVSRRSVPAGRQSVDFRAAERVAGLAVFHSPTRVSAADVPFLLLSLAADNRHFASVYGFEPTLGFGSGLIENALYLFVLSSFFWPFYYAFSPRAKRVFTR